MLLAALPGLILMALGGVLLFASPAAGVSHGRLEFSRFIGTILALLGFLAAVGAALATRL